MIKVRLTKEDLARARKDGLEIVIRDRKVYLWDELVLNFLQAKDLNVFIPHYKFLDAIVGSRGAVGFGLVKISMSAGERLVRKTDVFDRVYSDEAWQCVSEALERRNFGEWFTAEQE